MACSCWLCPLPPSLISLVIVTIDVYPFLSHVVQKTLTNTSHALQYQCRFPQLPSNLWISGGRSVHSGHPHLLASLALDHRSVFTCPTVFTIKHFRIRSFGNCNFTFFAVTFFFFTYDCSSLHCRQSDGRGVSSQSSNNK